MTFRKHKVRTSYLIVATAIIVILMVRPIFLQQSVPLLASGPLVHIPNSRVDLGRISQNANRDVSFSIENKGSRRLVLNEVGCGCGEPKRSAILVPSGKSENVSVHFESRHELGNIERTLSFTTNDETQPRIDLTVMARVMEDH